MTRFARFAAQVLPILAAVLLFPQCALVQTSRQVANTGTVYEGYNLGTVDAIWQKGGQYFVRCDSCRFTLHYPWVHDTVLLTDKQTTYTLLPQGGPPRAAFHAISRDVAYALSQTNGYDMMESLNRDIARQGGGWIPASQFPVGAAVRTPLRAELANTEAHSEYEVFVAGKASEMWPAFRWALAGLDAVVIDVPGTALYNAAIPLIVPFVAFHESAQPNPL